MAHAPDPGLANIGVHGRALRIEATPDLAIAHLRPTIPEHGIHRHQHADMHVVVLLAGHYVSDAAGMPAVCTEPAVIFNPPGTEHRDRFRSRDGLFLTLAMPSPAFLRFCDDRAVATNARRLPLRCLAHAMRLLPEVWRWDAASPLAVESVFADLLADVVPQHAHATDHRLRRVLDRLEDDRAPPPSVGELARIADLHPVHLARLFRRQHGISPSDYLRKRRLHRALSLIARRRTLAGTAVQLGFTDESHLHRAFVGEFGITPGAFRRLALGRADVARIQDARLRAR